MIRFSIWRNKIIHDNAQAELMYKHIHNRHEKETLPLSMLEDYINQFTDILTHIKEQKEQKSGLFLIFTLLHS